MSSLAIDFVFTLSGFALFAFELASFGQVWVLVVWISGFAFPQFGFVERIGQFMTIALTRSLK